MLTDRLRRAYEHLPEELRAWILVQRRSPQWLRSGIVFVHIPKSAGTSVNQALYGRFMGHVRMSDIHRWAFANVRALPSFAITRNPWDRLVSAYRFATRGHGLGNGTRAAIAHPMRYRTPEFSSFKTFVTDWLAKREICELDYVFQPQSLFVCDQKDVPLVDHLGRIEQMEPTLKFIEKTIGQRISISRLNLSGEPVDYRRFYTSSLAETVGRIYQADIDLFGYDFDDS